MCMRSAAAMARQRALYARRPPSLLPRALRARLCGWSWAALLMAVTVACGIRAASSQALEAVPPGEDQAIRTIVSLALAALEKRYPPDAPLVRRDAHAKPHGCVKASFRVGADLPGELRVGLAASPAREFKTWVRYSNGAFEPGPDTGMDGRGMAVKIMSAGASAVHDLLMINYPVFFSPDANDYLDFATAGALTGDRDGLKKYFFPSFNPLRWRVRQGLIAYDIAGQKIASPLSTQYFSMVPYLFGANRAVKYSARPCSGSPARGESSVDRTAGDFLKVAMQQELQRGPACFELMVQERRGSMPIEDATVEWSQSESPYRPIGTITIPQQEFDTPERRAFCENTAFSPWNAPPEHRPLGGINRIRKVLYEEISRFRRIRNNLAVPDPLELWDRLQ
jgi:hypothetical protein